MWNVGEVHRLGNDPETGAPKVSIFLRQLKNGQVYYGRFTVDDRKLSNGRPYITTSLKTDDFEKAKQRALQRYTEIKYRESLGAPITPVSVNEAINRFIAHYESNLKQEINGFTKDMLRTYRRTINVFWRDYVGGRPLDSIVTSNLEDYELWRRNWAKQTTTNPNLHGNYKTELKPRTIQWEVNAFKAMLRWCAGRGLYAGKAYEWSYKLRSRDRRSAFSLEQYRILVKYMQTNKFLYKGKHGHDTRMQRHRSMLRAYILFLLNTGLRVGEARYLRWKDVSEETNTLNQRVLLVRVSQTHSKVKKTREVVGRTTGLRALERWREFLEKSGEGWSNDNYIFCNPEGAPLKDLRQGFNAVIREAGVESNPEGVKYTPYCLRHTYITFRLRYGEKVRIHSLAKNCGTSVAMIEQFYSDAIPKDFKDELTL